ncbi:MAG: hypothetical protein AB8I08_11160 [Sandaracinaceae bacterium]
MPQRTLVLFGLGLLLALGCDETSDVDGGIDAATTDAGRSMRDAGSDAAPGDAGQADAGQADAGPTDAGPTDAGPGDAGSDAGPADAGPSDAGPSGCRCFSATQLDAIEAHSGSRQCFTGMNLGTIFEGEFSSTLDAQMVQVTVQEISGFAGVDWFCGAGCVDTNDDLIDDCADAPLGPYSTVLIDEAEHDRCEALIDDRCE